MGFNLGFKGLIPTTFVCNILKPQTFTMFTFTIRETMADLRHDRTKQVYGTNCSIVHYPLISLNNSVL